MFCADPRLIGAFSQAFARAVVVLSNAAVRYDVSYVLEVGVSVVLQADDVVLCLLCT